MTSSISPTPAGGSKSRRASPRIVTTPLLRVFVPGNAPSANHMYAARGRGAARYLTLEALDWRGLVASYVMPWRYGETAPRPNLRVCLIWMGNRSDIDNPIKLTLDGVKMGLRVDDRYVSELVVMKRPLAPGAERGAWIEVSELPPVEAQRAPRRRVTRNKSERSA